MFRKKQSVAAAAAQLRGGTQSPFGAGLPAVPPGEAQLYRAMRQSLPVLDAAIGKLVRLSGGFTVRSAQQQAAPEGKELERERRRQQAMLAIKKKFGKNAIIKGMDLGSVFHPRNIAADHIVRYVRAMQNSLGSNVETLYKIVGNKAEALEFRATEKSAVCGRPLMELPTRPNLLIGAINREGRIITPGGRDTIEPGDTVVVVTAATGLDDLDDILDKRRVKA